MLIFLYGTLKRNRSNHGHMDGQSFVAKAMTQPQYRLYDLGGYPGMVSDEAGGVSIQGEVWAVDADCVARLDELEDVDGGEYAREIIPLLPPFDEAEIEGYRYLRDVSAARDIGVSW